MWINTFNKINNKNQSHTHTETTYVHRVKILTEKNTLECNTKQQKSTIGGCCSAYNNLY